MPDERKPKHWLIVIQQRAPFNGRFPRDDWRAWRKFSVWPILFESQAAGETFMRENFTFRNLNGRKMSASVTSLGGFRKLIRPGSWRY